MVNSNIDAGLDGLGRSKELLSQKMPSASLSIPPGSLMRPDQEAVRKLTDRLHADLDSTLLDFPKNVTLLDVYFSYRLFLRRPPESADVCRHHAQLPDLAALFGSFLNSTESLMANVLPPEIPVVAETPQGFRFHFYLSDRYVGWKMAIAAYEMTLMEGIRRFVRPGMRCVDLGANIGALTLQMGASAGRSGAVHAFEPFPKNFELLKLNIEDNGMGGWVRAYPYAAHSRNGRTRLYFDRATQSDYWAMFVSTRDTPDSFDSIEVQQVALDGVIPASQKVDFIKMDIEGAELAAVEGMRRILSEDRPLMFFEFNPPMLRYGSGIEDATVLLDRLREFGYRIVPMESLVAGQLTDYVYQPELQQDSMANLAAVPVGQAL